jgi:hypothetical protein
MSEHSAVKPAGLGAILVIVVALVVAAVAIWMVDRSGEGGNGLPDDFVYQIDQYKDIDPSLIAYSQTLQFSPAVKDAKAVAVGPEDRIYVAGDRVVRVFDRGGGELSAIDLEAAPSCLAVAPDGHSREGQLLVGIDDHIEVFSADGERIGIWPSLGERAVLTSIALDEEDVFVADAGQTRVHRLSLEGEVIGTIGDRNPEEGQPGFAVPSPFFDVAIHPDGWLRVINPGALRVEAYSYDGRLELFWGEAAAAIEGFFGCCNPANMAVLPDGRYVTAEKGLIRVKIYSADGQFESVVAGPKAFGAEAAAANESLSDHEYTAVDVAVDGKGRVIVLDLTTTHLHVFEAKQAAAADQPSEADHETQ